MNIRVGDYVKYILSNTDEFVILKILQINNKDFLFPYYCRIVYDSGQNYDTDLDHWKFDYGDVEILSKEDVRNEIIIDRI